MADNVRAFSLAVGLVVLVSILLLLSRELNGPPEGGATSRRDAVQPTPPVLDQMSPLIIPPVPATAAPAAPPPAPTVPPTPAPTVTLAAGGEPITAEFELPILMYHRALPELPPDDPEGLSTVTTAELEAELAYLRCAGYTTMTVAQMFDVLDGKLRMPERPIILTFDDGTADHYSYVFPLLRRYGLTASFSIVTGTVGQGKEYLTWEQVREMSGAGMEMLSHTVTHLNLNEADESEIAAELAEAKETLEEQTGQPVRYFVYPSGEPFRSGTADREVAVATMLRQTGYRGALLAGLSQVTQDPSRPFQLHRMRIWNGQELAVFAGAMYGPAPEDYGCGTTAVLRDGSDSH